MQQTHILVGHLLAVHLADAVAQQTAVKADKAFLGQLTYQSCDVLVFNVGVGVKLASLSSVRSLTIAHEELEF